MNLFFYLIWIKALKTVKKLFLVVINGEGRYKTVWDGERRWETVRDGKGRECHDDGRSVTMDHDGLKMVMGR